MKKGRYQQQKNRYIESMGYDYYYRCHRRQTRNTMKGVQCIFLFHKKNTYDTLILALFRAHAARYQ